MQSHFTFRTEKGLQNAKNRHFPTPFGTLSVPPKTHSCALFTDTFCGESQLSLHGHNRKHTRFLMQQSEVGDSTHPGLPKGNKPSHPLLHRDRDSNSFCAPSSHPSRAPISTRLGTLTWHAKGECYPASLVVSRNEVFKTFKKPLFAQFERVSVPFLANKLAEHSIDVFGVSCRPFRAGIVRVDSAELACGDQKSTPRLRVIRPTLAAPFPGATTVTPTQVATTFYDFRRLGWTLRHC